MMRLTRRTHLTSLLIALGVAAFGCGDDGGGGSAEDTTTSTGTDTTSTSPTSTPSGTDVTTTGSSESSSSSESSESSSSSESGSSDESSSSGESTGTTTGGPVDPLLFHIDGQGAGDWSGLALDVAGDVNGDGLADLIIGAPFDDPNEVNNGRSYVVFGKPDMTDVNLDEVAAGVGGFALDGEQVDDYAGTSVAGAGDVDGDGLDDIIIGAYPADPNGSFSGRSYVVLGKDTTDSVELVDVAAGIGGFAIDGTAANDFSGRWVAAGGDINGDGLDDVVLGAIGVASFAGRAYVVFGKTDTVAVQLSDIEMGNGGFFLDGEQTTDYAGFEIDGVGDMNGDGLDDVIIASPGYPGGNRVGRAYVVWGKSSTTSLDLGIVAGGVGGFAITGEVADDLAAFSVAGAGDVDGDSRPDVVLGARDASVNGMKSGRSYVVFGKPDTTSVLLADVTGGVGGFAIDGEDEYDTAGRSVAGGGDMNGDGFFDIVIGAPEATPNGDDSGRAYIVWGKADTATVQLSDVVSDIGGFAFDGPDTDLLLGYVVAGWGDIDGNGRANVVVAAPAASYEGTQAGRSFVLQSPN